MNIGEPALPLVSHTVAWLRRDLSLPFCPAHLWQEGELVLPLPPKGVSVGELVPQLVCLQQHGQGTNVLPHPHSLPPTVGSRADPGIMRADNPSLTLFCYNTQESRLCTRSRQRSIAGPHGTVVDEPALRAGERESWLCPLLPVPLGGPIRAGQESSPQGCRVRMG